MSPPISSKADGTVPAIARPPPIPLPPTPKSPLHHHHTTTPSTQSLESGETNYRVSRLVHEQQTSRSPSASLAKAPPPPSASLTRVTSFCHVIVIGLGLRALGSALVRLGVGQRRMTRKVTRRKSKISPALEQTRGKLTDTRAPSRCPSVIFRQSPSTDRTVWWWHLLVSFCLFVSGRTFSPPSRFLRSCLVLDTHLFDFQ